ncbi:hypothetical protein CN562_10545 [Bacillus wiedmannii]|nr:hypothetical protein CN562_10545 [Bacillus wiedmannii]
MCVPIIELYKKIDNEEECIASFETIESAIYFSMANRIMNKGWVRRCLDINDYPNMKLYSEKYPHTNDYRFSFKYEANVIEREEARVMENSVLELRGKPEKCKIVLLHKVEEIEERIALFTSVKEAFKYSVENEIMSQNQVLMSLKRNIYPSLIRIPKAYPHTNEYRFAYIKN